METQTETKIDAVLRLREKYKSCQIGAEAKKQVAIMKNVFQESQILGIDERFIYATDDAFEIIKRQIK